MAIWKQHLVTVIAIIFAGGVAWAALNAQVGQNGALAQENKVEIEALKESLSTIKTNQAVMQEQLKNEGEKNQTFREDTGRALDRILRKLDGSDGDRSR